MQTLRQVRKAHPHEMRVYDRCEATIFNILPFSLFFLESYIPEQPLPPDWDLPSSSTGSSEFRVPISRRLGMWSFRCCNNCDPSCGGIFVQRYCVNRTTEEQIHNFACSRIPAVPVDSYINWALTNCSRANCPTWSFDGSYKTPALECGSSYAWPVASCTLNNVTLTDLSCWPERAPLPTLVNQSSCGNSISLLPFQVATESAAFEPRQFTDVAVLNGSLFLVGGLTKQTALHQDSLADVWRSDDYGQTWQQVHHRTPGFTAVQDHTLNVIGSSLFVVGGTQRGVPSEHVWRSDDFGKSWYICGYLFAGRAQHDSVIFLRSIVIVGGFSQSAVKNDVLRSTDGSHFYLQTASAPWAPRTYPSVDVVGDTIVLCGGWLQTGLAARDVWKSWDMVSWTLVNAATPWTPRVGFVFYSTHRSLVIVGGISESGNVYHQEQWISGDSGVTWQLRSPNAPVESGTTAPRPLSKRSWSAYTKMEGDRLFVLGGEYQGQLLNDVWLGDRSVVMVKTEPVKSGTTETVPTGSIIAIIVSLSSAAVFLFCVTVVLCRHQRVKRLEKQARAQQDEAALSLQRVRIFRPDAIGPSPSPSPQGDAISSESIEGPFLRSLVSENGSGVEGGGSGGGGVHSSVASGHHQSMSAASRNGLESTQPVPPTRSRTPSSGALASPRRHVLNLSSASGSGSGSGSGHSTHPQQLHHQMNTKHQRPSSSHNRSQKSMSSMSGSQTPRSSPRRDDDLASQSGSSAVHIHPLLVANGSVTPATAGQFSAPPPFAVDPHHLAWMQAQISYQASLLAAVVHAQSPPPPGASGSAPSPSSAAAVPPLVAEAEEYFRSVPQLSAQQAQLVYVQNAGAGAGHDPRVLHRPSAYPFASVAPQRPGTPLETNEGEEEFQPGQVTEPVAALTPVSDRGPPSASASIPSSVSSSMSSGVVVDSGNGSFDMPSPPAPTMAGVPVTRANPISIHSSSSSSSSSPPPPVILHTQPPQQAMPTIREGEDDGAEGQVTQ